MLATTTVLGAGRQRAAARLTRSLLLAGVTAGPLYLAAGLAQALLRPGFDLRRHDLSLLSNGDLGWIQVANFLLTGALIVAGAAGRRRAVRQGRGRTWVPILLAVYGLGLIGAGIFAADPAYGFPPGTPAGPGAFSWHGMLHLATAAVGFLALIAACLVDATRWAGLGRRWWAGYSVVTGVAFLAAFAGIAAGSGSGWAILGFWIGLAVAWSWISATSLYLLRAPAIEAA